MTHRPVLPANEIEALIARTLDPMVFQRAPASRDDRIRRNQAVRRARRVIAALSAVIAEPSNRRKG